MAKKVRKAVIPAAGFGTRFLPATKAMAKEMLPIVDKPTIQFIVEEALASGIEDILIITGKGKRPIEDHFDRNLELELHLEKKAQRALLDEVKAISNLNLFFIRQSEPLGLGHAVSLAKSFTGDEPFVVMLGDDLMRDEIPLTQQLINRYEELGKATLAVMEVPSDQTHLYGVIAPKKVLQEDLYEVAEFLEKPQPAEAPSNLAIIGRYLLTPAIFTILENLKPGVGNEIQLTDGIDLLNKQEPVLAHVFKGERYDVGDKLGFLKTSITYGLQHPEIGEDLAHFIKSTAKELD